MGRPHRQYEFLLNSFTIYILRSLLVLMHATICRSFYLLILIINIINLCLIFVFLSGFSSSIDSNVVIFQLEALLKNEVR